MKDYCVNGNLSTFDNLQPQSKFFMDGFIKIIFIYTNFIQYRVYVQVKENEKEGRKRLSVS